MIDTYRLLLTYQLREFHHHMFCCFIILEQMYDTFLNDPKKMTKKNNKVTIDNIFRQIQK